MPEQRVKFALKQIIKAFSYFHSKTIENLQKDKKCAIELFASKLAENLAREKEKFTSPLKINTQNIQV